MKTQKNKFKKMLSLVLSLFMVTTFTLLSCSSDDGGFDIGDGNSCTNCYTYRNAGNPQTVNISKVTYEPKGNNRMELKIHSNNTEEYVVIELEGDTAFSSVPEGTFTGSSSPVFFRRAWHKEGAGDTGYSVNAMGVIITIEKDGSNYKADFNFTSGGAGLVVGNYTGAITAGGDVNDPNDPDPNAEVVTTLKNGNGFNYKVFYQEEDLPATRRGIIILAVGDGGNANDGTLNDQCDALARKGFVAITTTYRTNTEYYPGFKEDMEEIIDSETVAFGIPKSNVVLGGLSRGGNRLHGAVLPEAPEYNIYPIEGIKGVILECAGGDYWKGRLILYPVLFMNNEVDNQVQTDNAYNFLDGLQENVNPGVANKSHCLIIEGSGHCTNSNQYKDFILQNIDSWFD